MPQACAAPADARGAEGADGRRGRRGTNPGVAAGTGAGAHPAAASASGKKGKKNKNGNNNAAGSQTPAPSAAASTAAPTSTADRLAALTAAVEPQPADLDAAIAQHKRGAALWEPARLESAENRIKLRDLYNGERTQDAFSRFDMLERRVDMAEGRADSLSIGQPPKSLEDEISELESSDKIEEQLAAMKAAKGGAKPAGDASEKEG